MNKLFFAVALGATIISTAAGAQGQGGGGWQQQDMNRQQAQQMADGMFQRLDVNHDGVVTRAEAEQAAQQAGGGGGRYGRMIERSFGTAQSLTLPQFEGQALDHFDAQDLNHDGVVTVAERQQGRAQRGERGENPGQ
jgi:Ca2+-binding EF-hand superfamily protein